jgi:hypothetical protein
MCNKTVLDSLFKILLEIKFFRKIQSYINAILTKINLLNSNAMNAKRCFVQIVFWTIKRNVIKLRNTLNMILFRRVID